MLKAFLSLIEVIWHFLKIPLAAALIIIAFFALWVMVNYLWLRFVKKVKPLKGDHYRVKQPHFLKRLFVLAPKRFAQDKLEQDPEFFRYQGIIVFTGRQGNGKTVSMVEFAMRMQQEYPKAVCLSNLNYKYADHQMESWDDLIGYQNPAGSKKGVIVLNDELQNTFNSKQSKDFPMEYLAIVTQNRKNRRVLLGTAQNFYMLSKDIRSQCTEIRKCTTFLGCITVVNVCIPEINNDGDVEKLKHRRFYWFVHSQELRDSYDTYEVINKMQKAGFKPRSEQVSAHTDVKSSIISIDKKVLKR